MPRKIGCRKRNPFFKIKKDNNCMIYRYNYPEEEILIKRDLYGRTTGLTISSYLPHRHVQKLYCKRKLRLVYDQKGYLSDCYFTNICHKNFDTQRFHYTYDTHGMPTQVHIIYLENTKVTNTETLNFYSIYSSEGHLEQMIKQNHGTNINVSVFIKNESLLHSLTSLESPPNDYETLYILKKTPELFEIYLSTGIKSFDLIKKFKEGITFFTVKNPARGKFLWRLLRHVNEMGVFDGIPSGEAIFEIKIFEAIFTVQVFSEIYHYARNLTDQRITIGITGLLFSTPQIEAIKIAEFADENNIKYYFMST